MMLFAFGVVCCGIASGLCYFVAFCWTVHRSVCWMFAYCMFGDWFGFVVGLIAVGV